MTILIVVNLNIFHNNQHLLAHTPQYERAREGGRERRWGERETEGGGRERKGEGSEGGREREREGGREGGRGGEGGRPELGRREKIVSARGLGFRV